MKGGHYVPHHVLAFGIIHLLEKLKVLSGLYFLVVDFFFFMDLFLYKHFTETISSGS